MAPFCPSSPSPDDAGPLRAWAAAVLGYLAPLVGFLLAVFAAAWLSGCDGLGEEDPERRVVLEAFLQAEAPLPPVRLSRTARVREAYSFEANAVSGAAVALFRQSEGGEEERIPYAEADTAAGVYLPVDPALTVASGARYRVEAAVEGAGTLRAETVVPTAFRILGQNADTLVYQADEQPNVTVTRSRSPGRNAIFLFGVEATGQLPEPDPRDLVPLICNFYEDDTTAFELTDVARGTSPVLNEEGYEVDPATGAVTIEVPWLAIAFFGETTLRASAIDDALYGFLTTQEVQFGGGTLSPGEIPNVDDNVEGGLGVFGAYAQVERRVVVTRRATDEPCLVE